MKSSCEQIVDYRAGDLGGDELDTFLTHLPLCQACQVELELDERLDQVIVDSWLQVSAPEIVLERLLINSNDFTSERVASRESKRFWLACISLAASILILASVSFWQFNKSEAPEISATHKPAPVQLRAPVDLTRSSNQSSIVAVIPSDKSNSIFFPQAQPNTEYTILRVYTNVVLKPATNNLPNGE